MKKLINKSKSTSRQTKLVIRRETIALLTSLQLSGVAGGVTGDACDTMISRTGPCDPL